MQPADVDGPFYAKGGFYVCWSLKLGIISKTHL